MLRRLWAPLASLGVGAGYLTNAARVETCYFDASSVAAETVQRELIRGLEQSGDVFVPRVTLVKRFPAALDAIGVTGRDPKRESVRALTASLEDDENEKAFRQRRADDVDAPLMLVAQPGSAVTLRARFAARARTRGATARNASCSRSGRRGAGATTSSRS